MCAKLAVACACSIERVNIKATTTEGLGFEGRGEGISAHAVVLLLAAGAPT
jgi:2-C-methyl-D-erythritol 2,4-cyclodiphosphate synthase